MKKHTQYIALVLSLLCLSACGANVQDDAAIGMDIPQKQSVSELNSDSDSVQLPDSAEDLPAPAAATATVSGNCSIRLSWEPVEGADGYLIYRSRAEAADMLLLLRTLEDPTAASTTDTWLDTDMDYCYTILPYVMKNGTALYGEPATAQAYLPAFEGFFTVDGVLFCYRDNTMVRSDRENDLWFDADGRYSTENEQLDEALRNIIRACTTSGMTQLERFKACYDWLIEHCEYIAVEYADMEDPDWEEEYTLALLQDHGGNCFSYAAATAYFARSAGFTARCQEGIIYQGYEWVDHCWTEVDMDGTTYVCDSEMEGVYGKNRDYDWDLFMKEYGDTPTTYPQELD